MTNNQVFIEALEERVVPSVFTVSSISDSGQGSLRQAIIEANAEPGPDTIRFDKQTFNTPQVITLTTGEIDISSDLRVVGPGKDLLTLDGNSSSRIFSIYGTGSSKVTISGLSLTGGASAQGGAIINAENLTLKNLAIFNNTATGSGGAVASSIGDLKIVDSQITANSSGDDGGGIFVASVNGKTSIMNTVISGNTASDDGGGVYIDSDSPSPGLKVQLHKTQLSGNTATNGAGGGAYIDLSNAQANNRTQLKVNLTEATGNTADAGGGIFVRNSINSGGVSISNSHFSGNDGGSYWGGLVVRSEINAGNVSVAKTTISSNVGGGARFDGGGSIISESTVELSLRSIDVAGNSGASGQRAGGLEVAGFAKAVLAGGSTISGNESPTGAGGLALSGPGDFSIKGGKITGNQGVDGGGISLLSGSDVTVSNSKILGNSASGDGGGVFGVGTDVTFLRSTISGNSSVHGGGIYFNQADSFTMRGSTISANSASVGGGGILLDQIFGETKITNTKIIGNHSDGTTGGIGVSYGDMNGSTLLRKVTIEGNSADGRAGGLSVGNDGPTSLERLTVRMNFSGNEGGGIFTSEAGQVTLQRSTVTDNLATSSGGGVFNQSGTMTVQIIRSIIAENSSQADPNTSGAVQFS